MRRRDGGRYSAGVGKRQGTPTVNPPEPQGIDQYSGFKVPLSRLRKDWQGLYTVSPDVRNPQDFLRGIKDNMALPYSSPEVANQFAAQAIVWQDGETFITTQSGGNVLYTQGVDAGDTL